MDIAGSNIVSDVSPQPRETKEKNKQMEHLKLKSTTKEKINKIKRQPTERENIFTNTSLKGFISKTNKVIIKLNTQKMNNSIKKWAKDLNRHFSIEDIHMANRHMRRCSMSLIMRKMQIKTTMKYHLTPVRMVIITQSTNNKCWQGCGERGMPLHYW